MCPVKNVSIISIPYHHLPIHLPTNHPFPILQLPGPILHCPLHLRSPIHSIERSTVIFGKAYPRRYLAPYTLTQLLRLLTTLAPPVLQPMEDRAGCGA